MNLYVPQRTSTIISEKCPSILDVISSQMTLLRFFQAICPATGVYKQGFESFGNLNRFSLQPKPDRAHQYHLFEKSLKARETGKWKSLLSPHAASWVLIFLLWNFVYTLNNFISFVSPQSNLYQQEEINWDGHILARYLLFQIRKSIK